MLRVVKLLFLVFLLGFPRGSGAETFLEEANNRFAFDLYRPIATADGDVFFSPYSISNALTLAMTGARGNTRSELGKTMHVDPDSPTLFRKIDSLRRSIVTEDNGAEEKFSVANSLWAEKKYSFLPTYFSLIKKYFQGEIHQIDFIGNADESRKTINRWVSDKTNNKINDLLLPNSVKPETRLILVNAVYLLAKWQRPFLSDATRLEEFHLSRSSFKKISMMRQTDYFNYADTDDAEIIELPYGANGDFVMDVLLPKANDLKAFENDLSEEKVTRWLTKLSAQLIELSFPKFKTELTCNLVDILRNLGISSAFDYRTADFSGMSGNFDLFIDKVIHKAFINLDENGTEAAAATAIILGMGKSAADLDPPQPIIFRADRPFIYLIREKRKGLILFMGRFSGENADTSAAASTVTEDLFAASGRLIRRLKQPLFR